MSEEQEKIVDYPSEDKTNWKAWYLGLILFLLLQIIIYFIITISY